MAVAAAQGFRAPPFSSFPFSSSESQSGRPVLLAVSVRHPRLRLREAGGGCRSRRRPPGSEDGVGGLQVREGGGGSGCGASPGSCRARGGGDGGVARWRGAGWATILRHRWRGRDLGKVAVRRRRLAGSSGRGRAGCRHCLFILWGLCVAVRPQTAFGFSFWRQLPSVFCTFLVEV